MKNFLGVPLPFGRFHSEGNRLFRLRQENLWRSLIRPFPGRSENSFHIGKAIGKEELQEGDLVFLIRAGQASLMWGSISVTMSLSMRLLKTGR